MGERIRNNILSTRDVPHMEINSRVDEYSSRVMQDAIIRPRGLERFEDLDSVEVVGIDGKTPGGTVERGSPLQCSENAKGLKPENSVLKLVRSRRQRSHKI